MDAGQLSLVVILLCRSEDPHGAKVPIDDARLPVCLERCFGMSKRN